MIAEINNTSGQVQTLGSYDLSIGVSTVFFNKNLFTRDNFISLVNLVQSGDIEAFDLLGNQLSTDDAIDCFNEVINDINSVPPIFITERPYNNMISKYVIGYILDYIEINAANDSDAASKYDLVDDLVSSLWFGSKPISIGHVSNLTDPFYTVTFKDKITDLVNSGYN